MDERLKQELVQYEMELLEAEQRHNVPALHQILAEEFVLVTTRGHRLPKNEFLGFLEHARMLHFELGDIDVREIGPGIALVLANMSVDMTVRDEAIPRQLFISTIWRRDESGHWLAVYNQNSAVLFSPNSR